MGPDVVTFTQLEALMWMHARCLSIPTTDELTPAVLECHPRVSNRLRQEVTYDYQAPDRSLIGLELVEIYPDFRDTEWRIMSKTGIELYHGVDPDGVLIRPAVLVAIAGS